MKIIHDNSKRNAQRYHTNTMGSEWRETVLQITGSNQHAATTLPAPKGRREPFTAGSFKFSSFNENAGFWRIGPGRVTGVLGFRHIGREKLQPHS